VSASGVRFRTVFLDRDGTINVKAPEGDYITTAADVRLLPGAGEAIRLLNASGRLVVVVSNQRGIARGRFTAQQLDEVTDRLVALLAEPGAHVDAFYYCPHEADACDCRKPLPGLLLRAARELPGVDLTDAVLIGDADSDLLAAAAAGVPAIKVGGRPASAAVVAAGAAPLAECADLAAAVDVVRSRD
jgi:D-glycero-D-manno-heptose 1,7-bisphosphate phosphatase